MLQSMLQICHSVSSPAASMKTDFHKNWESPSKCRKIYHKIMSFKLKELERKKESLRRKMKRFYKTTQRDKKAPTKKRLVQVGLKTSEDSFCTKK